MYPVALVLHRTRSVYTQFESTVNIQEDVRHVLIYEMTLKMSKKNIGPQKDTKE
jgi:hypothetical protein